MVNILNLSQKVTDPDQAVSDLEKLMGIDLRGYMEGTIAVPERLKIDKKKLRSYLNWALKLHDKGDDQGNYACCVLCAFIYSEI